MTAIAWPTQEGLATSLAEVADHARDFPGIGAMPDRPIRLILAPTRAQYDSLTRGRLPLWSEGAAFPDAGTIVLLTAHQPSGPSVLRHELGHLALRWHVGRYVPLWFEEGYAAVAAQEWDRLDALRLNWQLARGVRMDLDDVDRALRGARGDAETGYALATTAVLLLERARPTTSRKATSSCAGSAMSAHATAGCRGWRRSASSGWRSARCSSR